MKQRKIYCLRCNRLLAVVDKRTFGDFLLRGPQLDSSDCPKCGRQGF